MISAGDLLWWPAFKSEPAGVVIYANRARSATCLLISELGAPLIDVVSLRNERSKILDAVQ